MMQRFARRSFGVLALWLCGLSSAWAATFYVAPPPLGDDTRNEVQAQDPETPWATLGKAASETRDGDTVIVLPGVYHETLKPKKNNMTWRAEPRRQAILQPPSDEGVVVDEKNGIVIEGFVVKGGTTGIRYNKATGGALRDNVVYGAQFQGIGLVDSSDIEVEGNVAHSNGGMGIRADRGGNVTVRNNLVYQNDGWGISLERLDPLSSGSVVESNTVDHNGGGGVRVVRDEDQTEPVLTVNNIITNNAGVGLKNPDPALVQDDYNNVWGNGDDFDFPSGSLPGPHTLSVDPLYVDPDGGDNIQGGDGWEDDSYHLSRVSAGQSATSPCVDAGDPSVMVEGTTATDRVPDGAEGDPNDMGYHYPDLEETMEAFELTSAKIAIDKKNGDMVASYNLEGHYVLGEGAAIDPSTERIRVEVDAYWQTLPVGSCALKNRGSFWLCTGTNPGVTSVKIKKDGYFEIIVKNIDIPPPPLPFEVHLNLFIGNDVGRAEVLYTRGTLKAP